MKYMGGISSNNSVKQNKLIEQIKKTLLQIDGIIDSVSAARGFNNKTSKIENAITNLTTRKLVWLNEKKNHEGIDSYIDGTNIMIQITQALQHNLAVLTKNSTNSFTIGDVTTKKCTSLILVYVVYNINNFSFKITNGKDKNVNKQYKNTMENADVFLMQIKPSAKTIVSERDA